MIALTPGIGSTHGHLVSVLQSANHGPHGVEVTLLLVGPMPPGLEWVLSVSEKREVPDVYPTSLVTIAPVYLSSMQPTATFQSSLMVRCLTRRVGQALAAKTAMDRVALTVSQIPASPAARVSEFTVLTGLGISLLVTLQYQVLAADGR